ncbi:MAG TPA: hypothetical protein DCQ93_09150 [Bacteroidetes bacterium]|nr:hypothetical protein [Bacteroidota bacterium]
MRLGRREEIHFSFVQQKFISDMLMSFRFWKIIFLILLSFFSIKNSTGQAERIISPAQAQMDSLQQSKHSWKLISPQTVLQQNSKKASAEIVIKQRNDGWKSWMFYLLLGLLIFLVFIRINYAREFSETFLIFKPIGINQQLFRDNYGIARLGSFFISTYSSLIIGVYIFLLGFYFHFIPSDSSMLVLAFSVAIGALLFRFAVLRVAGVLFPFKKEIRFYQYNEIQINRVTGILLLPVLFLVSFSPPLVEQFVVVLSLIIFGCLILFRYLRGFIIGADYFRRHKFHFLIYICALEISPAVILIKVVREWASGL